jgi:hypothetical protein
MKVFLLFTFLFLFSACDAFHLKPQSTDYYLVVPLRNDSKSDAKWAGYLRKHLDNRSALSESVLTKPNDKQKQIMSVSVMLNTAMLTDYAISYTSHGVCLKAKDENKMLWLIYQFISMIGDRDKRFDVTDLPSPMLAYGKNEAANFAFNYRSIYSLYNKNPEMFPILGASHVDYDWAIWGHNLGKILVHKSDDCYARTATGRDKKQFCFSSFELYNELVEYISNNYGDEKSAWFCIMPNDNDVVCQCPRCKKAGNTLHDAAPSVIAFVERLAHRFPNHTFVTSHYLTMSSAPAHRLPKNMGVIVSAMDLPLQANVVNSVKGQCLLHTIKEWRKYCSRVYIWDYNRNYDDYLSPFPCLLILQQRLQFYKQNGVSGVVFNDSGDNFSSFDDMQTAVISQLLINPSIDVQKACCRFFKKFYPKTSNILIQYYNAIENRAFAVGKPLEFYGGIGDAVEGYLDVQEFNTFFCNLEKASKETSGDERTRLNKLLTALNYTRFELMRFVGKSVNSEMLSQIMHNLSGHKAFPEMNNYREANGTLEDYINFVSNHKLFISYPNPLANKISSSSRLDEGQLPLSALTDGKLGIPFDYHTHWLVFSGDSLHINISCVQGRELQMNFMEASPWHIFLPKSVKLCQEGKVISEVMPIDGAADDFTRHTISIPLKKVDRNMPVNLIIIKSGHSFAIDEIMVK